MGQPRIKWGQVERFLLKRGFEIKSAGGEKIIVPPKTSDESRSRQTLRIGHTSCNSAGTELLKVYVSKLRNLYGFSVEDILRG